MSLDSIAGNSASLCNSFQCLQADKGNRFKAADSDSSGGISLEEFSAVGDAREATSADAATHAERFAALDADGDGQLNMQEMAAGAPPKMDGLSSDMMSMLLQTQEDAGQQAGPPPPPPPSDESSNVSVSDLTETLTELLSSGAEEEEES